MATNEDKESIFSSISGEISAATGRGISSRIEEEEKNILENKEGGFWGFLKSIIFSIAKALGLEGMLANMFGMPIPETSEIQKVSTQVGNATARTLTDQNFSFTNKSDFETQLKAKINASVSPTKGLNGERVSEIANNVVQESSQRFAELFDAQGNRAFIPAANLSPVDTLAAKKLNDGITKELQSNPQEAQGMAQLAGIKGENPRLNPEQIKALATALGPKLAALKAYQGELAKLGDNVFDQVSGELRASLKDNKTLLGKNGMNFSDENAARISHMLAGEVVKGIGIDRNPPQSFVNDGKVVVSAIVADKFVDTLGNDNKSRTALAALVGQDDLQPSQLRALANILAPTLVELDGKKDTLEKDANAYQHIAGALNKTLQGNIAALEANGMVFDKDGLQVLVNEFTAQLAPKLGVTSSPPAAFTKAAESLKQKVIKDKVSAQVSNNVAEEIVNATALEFYSRKPAWLDGDIRAMEPYYYKGKDGKYHRNDKPDTPELKEAQQNSYDDVVTRHQTLNKAQRDKVAKIVGETVNDYISDPANKEAPKEKMAADLKTKIAENLKNNTDAINGLSTESTSLLEYGSKYRDNTIDIINANNSDDIFAKIANGVADNVRGDIAGGYTKIKAAQVALMESKASHKAEAVEAAKAAVAVGASQGTEAKTPSGLQIVGISQPSTDAGVNRF